MSVNKESEYEGIREFLNRLDRYQEAVEKVKEDPRTRGIFAYFKEPWFFLETQMNTESCLKNVDLGWFYLK